MRRWEYAVVEAGTFIGFEIKYRDHSEKTKGNWTEILNRLGESGWELVAVTAEGSSVHIALFKREVS